MRVVSILLTLIFCVSLKAQSSEDSTANLQIPFFQIGLSLTDVAVPALTGELVFRAAENQQIGLRLSIPHYFSHESDDIYQGTNWALKSYLFHKYLIPFSDIEALTIRNGLRAGISDLYYDTEAWVASERFGNTVFTYENIQGSDRNISLGYELQVGWFTRSKNFYTEFSVGLFYETYINTESMSVLEYDLAYNSEPNYFGPGYEYQGTIRPTFNIVIGLNFD